MKTVVLYHSKCFDGTMAAAGALKAIQTGVLDKGTRLSYISYPQAELDVFFSGEGHYSRESAAERFIFVDFCPKAAVVLELVERGHSVVVLDHHATALSEVGHLRDVEGVTLNFDMKKSGARLSWEFFHAEVPALVEYVEDRDLWKWEMPKTREVMAWLSAVGQTNNPETYLKAIRTFEEDSVQAVTIGSFLVKEMNSQVKNMGDRFRYLDIHGYGRGAFVNAGCYPSEVCEYIYDNFDVPFVLAYSIGKDGRVPLSIRSKQGRDSSVDVAAMSQKMFNGGGHKHAAGGVTTVEMLNEFLELSEDQEENRSSNGKGHRYSPCCV